MPIINQSALVPYSAQQMYNLVNDYKQYPAFLPGCIEANTISVAIDELQAELVIQKFGITQRFSTHNTMIPNSQIKMKLIDGPFHHLQGYWSFVPLDEESCTISFQLDFEFSNSVISLIFSKIFHDLTQKMLHSFKQRAQEIYGS